MHESRDPTSVNKNKKINPMKKRETLNRLNVNRSLNDHQPDKFMKNQPIIRSLSRWPVIGIVLAFILMASPSRALFVIGSAPGLYTAVSDSSHFNSSFVGANLFNFDVTGIPLGTSLSDGLEFAKSGAGTSFVAFQLNQVYTNIGSVFYAQRAGSNPNLDKISQIRIWTSPTTPFTAGDPGTTPDSVIAITNATGAVWDEYLMTNTISGQYFLLGLDQAVNGGNPGGKELRLGAIVTAPVITVQPVGTALAVGQALNLNVTAIGPVPFFYQWFTNNTAILNATNNTYNLTSVQASDAAAYTVVVTNGFGVATSTVATVSVRVPLTLTWLGSMTLQWDTNTVNWDSNADGVADAAYTQGDNVIFDDNGTANSTVDVSALFSPSSVVVSNTNIDYTLTTSGSGAIVGSSRLTKLGTGMLTLDINNTYTGSTVILNGTLVVGAGGPRGSLGTGPITNQAVLQFNGTGTVLIPGSIAGSGNLIKNNTGSVSLLGTNTMSGAITLNAGSLTLGASALGASTNIIANNGNNNLIVSGGIIVSNNVSLTAAAPDNAHRFSLITAGGTNIWNGSIHLTGNSPVSSVLINAATGSPLTVNGSIDTDGTYFQPITLRGANGFFNAQVNTPGALGIQKTDGGTWIVTGTNNSYLVTRMAVGVLKLGNDNAIATNSYLYQIQGASTFDLGGFSQIFSGIQNNPGIVGTIANSSTNSDSRLTIVPATAASSLSSALASDTIIADSTAGGTRKVSLTVNLPGGSLTLSHSNTYSGDTTITAGTLAVSGNGAISGSTPINLAAGATLDASGRNDGTLTLGSNQVLKGDGAFNVLGTLVNNGTIELKVNKNGATLTNDNMNGLTSVTYGGTLKLDVTASPALTTNDSITLFSAGSYSGAFANIVPSVPVFGLAWDTSTLATDGTLRIATGPATNPTNVTALVVGGNTLQLSWPANHLGWRLQAQTNGLSTTNWFNVQGSATTNQVILPIVPTNGSVFYRMVYP